MSNVLLRSAGTNSLLTLASTWPCMGFNVNGGMSCDNKRGVSTFVWRQQGTLRTLPLAFAASRMTSAASAYLPTAHRYLRHVV